AAGWTADPGEPSTCIDDPCLPDPCSGHGACAVLAGGGHECACAGHWTGPACDACDDGYAGDGCGDCAAGWTADPGEPSTCIDDPCLPDPCSGHGACAVLAGGGHECACTGHFAGPACDACDDGYAGDGCADCAGGYVADPGAPGTCVDDPCTPDPCSGHGACAVLAGGAAKCTCTGHFDGPACAECADGYAGAACGECAPGFVEFPIASGLCIDDPCSPDPCSGRGTCSIQAGGAGECTCQGHWAPPACAACATGWGGADCRECAAGWHDEHGGCVADVAITGCGIEPPSSFWTEPSEATTVRGGVQAAGTAEAGRLPGIDAMVCTRSGTMIPWPANLAAMDCSPATYGADAGGYDGYSADVSFVTGGTYSFVYVFSGDGAKTWTVCDRDGVAADGSKPGVASCNNVPNGGFERWSGDPEAPEGWTADAQVTALREDTLRHSGLHSVRLTRTGTENAQTDFVAAEHPVTPNATVTLSMWFYDNDPHGRGTLIHHWFDASHVAFGGANYSNQYTTDSADWRQMTRTVTVPATAAYVRLSVRVYAPAGQSYPGGVVYLDDVAVVP
ncbi:MAG: hypothetical protein FJ087_10110, partial [Deltaproteobacteria bacterium]|nr:hypothetical protein [Deltaproteobacteria bacterium]